ncbi:hypothetical protein BpHYR1_051001 [Brachionus plicatilis]|uniref:Uncharacterized protein n=1 Tax=Brachionus plicatilis TaxID=10195 RepID=A0A3M7QEF8_BRAPC|nr:hypothetical protein BpHYR1_051001 [Brachionus plicatilis]
MIRIEKHLLIQMALAKILIFKQKINAIYQSRDGTENVHLDKKSRDLIKNISCKYNEKQIKLCKQISYFI